MKKTRAIPGQLRLRSEPTWCVDIFIAGDLQEIRSACRRHTLQVGLCVTVTPCDFVFTGGMESGARIGLVHYPRFPLATPDKELLQTARALAERLLLACSQMSVLIVDQEKTYWLTRREQDRAITEVINRGEN